MFTSRLLAIAAIAAIPNLAPAQDITGAYGGLAYGRADIDTNSALGGSGESLGLFGGYNFDAGAFVYGFEIDWDSTDYAIGGGAVNIDSTTRIKGRIGADLGGSFAYATAGLVFADTDVLGDDDGYLYGIGLDVPLTSNLIAGGEVLQHEFDNFNGSGTDVSVTTYKARLAFRF